MHSKNKRAMDADEKEFVGIVKSLACVVCGAQAPSEAHEPKQGLWFLSVPLCYDCHRGAHGWHGDKSRWRAAKMTPELAQNETIKRVNRLRSGKPVITGAPARPRSRGTGLSSSKILPRAAA